MRTAALIASIVALGCATVHVDNEDTTVHLVGQSSATITDENGRSVQVQGGALSDGFVSTIGGIVNAAQRFLGGSGPTVIQFDPVSGPQPAPEAND